jgi:hypothetical protein
VGSVGVKKRTVMCKKKKDVTLSWHFATVHG